MQISLLGPMAIRDGTGAPVELAGTRLRLLLARLALDAGRPVSAGALIDAVWGDAPPAGGLNALQTLVSRLRRAVPVRSLPTGYVLDAAVDITQFEDLASVRDVAGALALWRGELLADLGPPEFAQATAARLAELRLDLLEDRPADPSMIAELDALIAVHPLRERLHGQRMRALHAAGRTAEALVAYEQLRATLAETLGADPSPELRALHAALLRDDRTNLRPALTSFVGRDEDVRRVDALLAGARLVTLAGPGGAGKTRLATEAGRRWAARLPDGVWMAELAGVQDPAEVPAAVLGALGRRSLAELRDRSLLLVLDNCEHLAGACAHLAEELLAGCPGIRILATSREPLAIGAEVLFPLAPLSLPAAVQLFVDRAGATRPGFRLTPGTRPAVEEICRRLDGLPLAVELACARLRTLPAGEIAARLGDRFRLLTGGSRTALPRHRTLYAVVEWSWELLTPAERELAERLSVFPDGATPESAEAVCGHDVLDLLGALADKSFVELRDAPGDPPRYRMLETIRSFAAEKLAASGEADRVRRAHTAYFLARAEAAEPALRSRDQLVWLAWWSREYDNVVTALRWAVDAGEADMAVRFVTAMGWLWVMRSDHAEGAARSREVLGMPGAGAAATAAAWAFDAMHHFAVDDFPRANASVETAVRLAGRPGAGQVAAGSGRVAGPELAGSAAAHPAVLMMEAIAGLARDDMAAARARLERLVDHDDPWVVAFAHALSGHAAEAAGDAAGASAHFRAALAGFTATGDRWGVSGAIVALSADDQLAGNHAAAIEAATRAAELAEAIGAVDDVAWMLIRRGTARLRSGDPAGARGDLAAARATGENRRSGAILLLADTGLAELARHGGDPGAARTLLTGVLARTDGAEGLPGVLRTQALTALGRAETAAGDPAAARDRLGTALDRALADGERPTIAGVAEALADLAAPAEAARLLGLAAATRGAPDRGNPDVLRTEAAARAALGDAYAAAYEPAATLDVAAAVAAIGSYGGTPPGSPATPPPHDRPAGAASGREPRPTAGSPG